MKSLLLTNEFPPHTYGGAGVHVDYLSRELARRIEVDVRCFGDQASREGSLQVRGFGVQGDFACPAPLKSTLGAVERCTAFNKAGIDADVVHCHTWYAQWGGILAKLNYGIPLVITVHSLEPLRPWKREQLGHGYDFTVWLEKTAIEMADAVIAVSGETQADILRHFHVPKERVPIIYNGIDPAEYQPAPGDAALRHYGIRPDQPFVLFVGRIARQKGIVHLAHAIRHFDPGFQVVLCAGAPDTPEIATEMKAAVERARSEREGIIWIEEKVEKSRIYQLYSQAAVFVCPSIYEPFGIINLEAMACETAVVASAVGGIPEVVVDGETGLLVPLTQQQESPFEPVDPEQFARDLAGAVNCLMRDPARREAMGRAGRQRAVEQFSWGSIAEQTIALYERLIAELGD